MRTRRETVLRPQSPSHAVEAACRRRLLRLIDEMGRSYARWVLAAWRRDEPRTVTTDSRLASLGHALDAEERFHSALHFWDVGPVAAIQDKMSEVGALWMHRFDEESQAIARQMVGGAARHVDRRLRKSLKDKGLEKKLGSTPAAQDAVRASVAESVALISDLPRKHALAVEGAVMRAVQSGGDMKTLTADLRKIMGITRRRAVTIARDQNNKATAAVSRARMLDLGIGEAIWLHSGGGKHPRPSHVKQSGKRYDVARGWLDPEVKLYVHPGTLINCRCSSRPVLEFGTKGAKS
jgi:SPP1 gp7 family putative phage head morphogenesis protein